MTSINIDDMFGAIKSSLAATSDDGLVSFREKVKFELGKDYLVRLIPYKADLSKSIVHHVNFSYKKHDGTWGNVLSGRTFGERCAMADYYDKIRFNGSDAEKERQRESMWKKEGWYVNAYIIRDGSNPENNGKVKILDLGFALYKLVERAMNGEFDKAWSAQANAYRGAGAEPISISVGKKIFDLSDSGANLHIHCRKNDGGMHDYKSSEITLEDAALGFTPEQVEEIYNSCFDLTKLDRVVDSETALKEFRETYIGFNQPAEMSPVVPTASSPMSTFMSSSRPAEEPVVVQNTEAPASLPMTASNPFAPKATAQPAAQPAESSGTFATEAQMDDFLKRFTAK